MIRFFFVDLALIALTLLVLFVNARAIQQAIRAWAAWFGCGILLSFVVPLLTIFGVFGSDPIAVILASLVSMGLSVLMLVTSIWAAVTYAAMKSPPAAEIPIVVGAQSAHRIYEHLDPQTQASVRRAGKTAALQGAHWVAEHMRTKGWHNAANLVQATAREFQ